ncbi:hypothetical protein [Actinobaculum suis]|uniref:hypothetical protein n=1 Tax=Actinobaculum suis TaxID=1657 RepID=UPI000AF212FA|nr:hypothetical protein [Actinobaculum suis]
MYLLRKLTVVTIAVASLLTISPGASAQEGWESLPQDQLSAPPGTTSNKPVEKSSTSPNGDRSFTFVGADANEQGFFKVTSLPGDSLLLSADNTEIIWRDSLGNIVAKIAANNAEAPSFDTRHFSIVGNTVISSLDGRQKLAGRNSQTYACGKSIVGNIAANIVWTGGVCAGMAVIPVLYGACTITGIVGGAFVPWDSVCP